jgi:cell division septation protein DedD
MRFEIRGGGIAVILIAIMLLSVTVFFMGLFAGYDVGRQTQVDTSKVVTAYPVQPQPAPQNPPAANPAPSSPVVAANEKNPVTAAPPAPPSMATTAQSSTNHGNVAAGAPSRQHLESAKFASSSQPAPRKFEPDAPGSNPAPVEDSAMPPDLENSAAPAPQPVPTRMASTQPPAAAPARRRKPFNIQIQAAMDINGANQMMMRLQRLGYQPHLVPTEISGQRWYKVEVGPYSTQEDALAAEAQLRAKYNATYGGGARGASSQPPNGDDTE